MKDPVEKECDKIEKGASKLYALLVIFIFPSLFAAVIAYVLGFDSFAWRCSHVFVVSMIFFTLHYRSTEAKKEKVRTRNVIFSVGDVTSPWMESAMQGHPATCDCSGREKCERFNKTGEGEMIKKDGWLQCPCGEFKQHKL